MSFAAETFKPNIYFKLNSNCLFGLAWLSVPAYVHFPQVMYFSPAILKIH